MFDLEVARLAGMVAHIYCEKMLSESAEQT